MIELVDTALGQPPQRPGELRLAQRTARPRDLATRQERVQRVLIALNLTRPDPDELDVAKRDRRAVLGQPDRVGEHPLSR